MTDTERLDWLDAVGFHLSPIDGDADCRWCVDDRNEVARTRYWYAQTIREAIDEAYADVAASSPQTPPHTEGE